MSKQMITQLCMRRLQTEYKSLVKDPLENMKIYIPPENMLKWYFCIYDLNDIRYKDGEYYGLVEIDPDYPLKPPKYYMYTPNGRFETHVEICTSNSNFHPDDWKPTWTMDALFRGFLSLFLEDNSEGQIYFNHLRTNNAEKKRLAKLSKQYNCKNNKKLYDAFISGENVICIRDQPIKEEKKCDRPAQKIKIELKKKS